MLKIGLFVLMLGVIGVFVFFNYNSFKPKTKSIDSSVASLPQNDKNETQDPNEPPLKMKHLGFNLDYYDPQTKKAGDIDFTLDPYDNRLWTDFGHKDTQSGKIHPQPIFQLPVGTKVYAIADGVVVEIPKLYSNDFSIQVAIDQNSKWRYETEHVVNVKVKVGDKVKAGQEIAEVGPDNNRNYGFLDIGILKGGEVPKHACPFNYLDDSIKEKTFKKIKALYASWEEYKGNPNIYDESSTPVPGCVTLDLVEG